MFIDFIWGKMKEGKSILYENCVERGKENDLILRHWSSEFDLHQLPCLNFVRFGFTMILLRIYQSNTFVLYLIWILWEKKYLNLVEKDLKVLNSSASQRRVTLFITYCFQLTEYFKGDAYIRAQQISTFFPIRFFPNVQSFELQWLFLYQSLAFAVYSALPVPHH